MKLTMVASCAIVALCMTPQIATAKQAASSISAFEVSPANYNVTFDLPPSVREKYQSMFQTVRVKGSLRTRFAVSVEGQRLRVRVSNELASEPLHLRGASIALAADGLAAVPGSLRRLTFGGQSDIVIPPGAPALSDPVDLTVSAGQDLVGTVFTDQDIPASPLSGIRQAQIDGDAVMDTAMAGAKTVLGRPLISGVLVETRRARPVVVALGDSITDAGRMDPAKPHGWVATLVKRLASAHNPASAVSAGIGGNRMLLDAWGPSALARADRDVFAVPGVTHVIMLEGINDIGMSGQTMTGTEPPLDLNALLQAYAQIAARAHARGLKIYIGTLTPFRGAPYFTEQKEQMRLAANAWIRTSGLFDGVIDFEAAVRDPAKPDRLLSQYDSGDHLHPSDAGYRAMGEAVPLSLLAK